MPSNRRSGTDEKPATDDGDRAMTLPAESMPERPDLASERPQPESEPPERDGPEVPEDAGASSDERALQDVVDRDHPLS
jgi:hypothetical protein